MISVVEYSGKSRVKKHVCAPNRENEIYISMTKKKLFCYSTQMKVSNRAKLKSSGFIAATTVQKNHYNHQLIFQ
jgi:hypothetical protein